MELQDLVDDKQEDGYVEQSDEDLSEVQLQEKEEEEDGLVVQSEELDEIMKFVFGDSDLLQMFVCKYSVILRVHAFHKPWCHFFPATASHSDGSARIVVQLK